MPSFVSAGVYILENDDSLYAPAISPTVVGIVGTATKGPLNVATLVTSEAQLIDTFGVPRSKDMGMQTAIEVLRETRQVYYCRIAGASAAAGLVNVMDAGSGATSAQTPDATSGETYHLSNGATVVVTGTAAFTATFTATPASRTSGNGATFNFATIDGGNPVVLTLSVNGGPTQTATISAGDVVDFSAVTAIEVAALLNAQISGVSVTHSTGNIILTTDRRGTSASLNVTGGTMNDATDGLDLATGATAGGGNVADISAVTGVEFKTVVEAASSAGVVVEVALNGAPSIRTAATGAASTITLGGGSTALGAYPLVPLPTGVAYTGSDTAAAANTIRFSGASQGSHSAGISVVVSTSAVDPALKRVVVRYRGVNVETFDALYKGTDPALSGVTYYEMIDTIVNGSADGAYSASRYITASDLNVAGEDPANGSYTLSAGNDGDDWTAGSVVGTVSGSTRTGLQVFGDPEQIYITLLATPGIAYPAVITAGINICEERKDCMYVADPPQGLEATEVVAWHNGLAGQAHVVDQEGRAEASANTAVFNTSYGALWSDYWTAFDKYNNATMRMPPSALWLRTAAYTDAISDPFIAAAGPVRTRAASVLGLESSPSQGERDLMQMAGNNVNPIIRIAGVGIAIYGQKTLQKAPTALDRVNVRRLLLYAKKIVAVAAAFLVFDQNDSVMWRRFVNLVQPIFDDIKRRRGLFDFRVIADSSTNTPLLIDQNTFNSAIFLKPTKTAEKIVVGFNIVPTGANFDDFTQA